MNMEEEATPVWRKEHLSEDERPSQPLDLPHPPQVDAKENITAEVDQN